MTYKKGTVSYSEVMMYNKCSYQWWLNYEKGLYTYQEGIFAVFGTAVHSAIDKTLKTKNKDAWKDIGLKIKDWINKNPDAKFIDYYSKNKKLSGDELIKDAIREWAIKGIRIYDNFFSWLEDKFPDYKYIKSESKLRENIENSDNIKFSGFIDLIIQDKEGIYHIIDMKTCEWGWGREDRSDTKKQYQLSLYKKFFCQETGIDPKNVKTHFILLKRTPSKNAEIADLYTITSGPKKLKNATEWLHESLKGMSEKKKFKNKSNCQYCPFLGTKHCT